MPETATYDPALLPSKSFNRSGQQAGQSVKARQKSFLSALEQVGTYNKAAQLIGIDNHTVSRWIKKSLTFRTLALDAKAHAEKYVILDQIEDNFYERAIAGKSDQQSAVIGMFITKKINNAYRDNAVVNVQTLGPVAMQFNLNTTPQPVVGTGDSQGSDE